MKKVFAVSLQALSGAGYPGVASLWTSSWTNDSNIKGEEEKVEWEPRKMLGKLGNGKIDLHGYPIQRAHQPRGSDGWSPRLASVELTTQADLKLPGAGDPARFLRRLVRARVAVVSGDP
ncbi:MAG: hypothetical protein U0X92_06575 [Anaerolineales bacterium]